MTKSKITAATLTALTLVGTLAATSGTVQAHHSGTGVSIDIAAGALIGAAAVPSPAPMAAPCTSRQAIHRAA